MKGGNSHKAAEWIARLDRGALTAETLLEFREWLEADVANLKQFELHAAAWDQLDELRKYRQVFAEPRRTVWRSRAVVTSLAAALGLIVIGFWGLPEFAEHQSAKHQTAHLQTAVGHIRGFTLSDGSTVKLNTGSEVDIRYTEAARTVVLEHGEAYFDVVYDPDRAFVVETPLGTVTAVGTSFLVRLGTASTKVTVQSGRVKIDPPTGGRGEQGDRDTGTAMIDAGQTATIAEESVAIRTLDPSSLFRQLAWRDGMLIFEGEPLRDVIDEFNRYASQKIVIGDPALRDMKLGGYFPVGDTEALVRSLQASFRIKVEQKSDGSMVLYQKSQPIEGGMRPPE